MQVRDRFVSVAQTEDELRAFAKAWKGYVIDDSGEPRVRFDARDRIMRLWVTPEVYTDPERHWTRNTVFGFAARISMLMVPAELVAAGGAPNDYRWFNLEHQAPDIDRLLKGIREKYDTYQQCVAAGDIRSYFHFSG